MSDKTQLLKHCLGFCREVYLVTDSMFSYSRCLPTTTRSEAKKFCDYGLKIIKIPSLRSADVSLLLPPALI